MVLLKMDDVPKHIPTTRLIRTLRHLAFLPLWLETLLKMVQVSLPVSAVKIWNQHAYPIEGKEIVRMKPQKVRTDSETCDPIYITCCRAQL